ncbi:large ribosomal subunit protein mL41 [Labrus bergylta]|uniref:Mitochondrial ribosomal protein L41 n=1 Tax=Labrus bergylta TaxID=56723 RepID=A0A3Q3KZ48_9LABR|nr:39S ribosomal protein L41, mitochondrial [Labrus bergylta]
MLLPVSQSLSVSFENRTCVTLLVPGQSACSRFSLSRKGKRSDTMGVLSTLMRGLVRGADRMSEFTSKRGSRTHNKGRGARPTGLRLSSRKFLSIQSMIPEFVVPHLEGFKLKPYVSYRSPRGTEPPVTAQSVFAEVVAPQIKASFEEGTFSKDQLEKYGFNPTQKGKLFKLYPKNYVR